MKLKLLLYLPIAIIIICCVKNNHKKVGLQPYGNFDDALCDTVANTIRKTYGFSTYLLTKKEYPKEAYINVKSPRYRADKIIKFQKESKPDSLDYIVGLINQDISCTKKDAFGNVKQPEEKYTDWGICGLGYRPGSSSVVSTFRLKRDATHQKMVERLKKIAIHELGHNLGLPHCENHNCVMRDAAESISTIDQVKLALCEKCKRKIN